MDEQEAIRRLQAGDLSGLETLVRTYQRPALRVAYAITRDAALAEDIAQGAFLRAYERIDQFELGRPFGPWFLRSVANAALRTMARRRRQLPLEAEVAQGGTMLASADPGPAQWVEQAETSEELWQALGQISPPLRAAVVLRYYVGLSEAEIAEQLACAQGTIKWRLSAARRRLR
ncbi:MAG TPA: sigma-70 family RNA polymerase sigma factor [Anaerolineae bacterium]|nr:sigma-70 family RNA polymerase sigma factor [Anaerolineae bacterium]HOR01264.1 sigma-70 family RNA polymerase sigma factor [Anaerolineae bacterium]HPL29355.1 sigma-70 family RNA polymerase sigma factor [Anaerolineae bacterium]